MAGSRNLQSGNGFWSWESEQTKYSHSWHLGNRFFSVGFCLEKPISKGQKPSAFRHHALFDRLASGGVLR